MAKSKNHNGSRFTIGIGGGHREYQIFDINYVVSAKFVEPSHSKDDETLTDKMESIINNEFVELPIEEETEKRSKPVRSAAGKER